MQLSLKLYSCFARNSTPNFAFLLSPQTHCYNCCARNLTPPFALSLSPLTHCYNCYAHSLNQHFAFESTGNLHDDLPDNLHGPPDNLHNLADNPHDPPDPHDPSHFQIFTLSVSLDPHGLLKYHGMLYIF